MHDLRQHGVHVTALGRAARPEASYIAMGDAPWCPTRLARIIETAEPDVDLPSGRWRGRIAGRARAVESGVATSVMQALREVQARPLLVCCGSAAEYGAAIVDGVPVCETAVVRPGQCVRGQPSSHRRMPPWRSPKATGTPVLVARIFNPIGPGMPPYLALGEFARQIALLPVLRRACKPATFTCFAISSMSSTLRRRYGSWRRIPTRVEW